MADTLARAQASGTEWRARAIDAEAALRKLSALPRRDQQCSEDGCDGTPIPGGDGLCSWCALDHRRRGVPTP
jgi:hypothetical protein